MIPSFVSMTRLFMAASTTIPSKDPVASVIISPSWASPASSVPLCVPFSVSVKISFAASVSSESASAIASVSLTLSASCEAVALSRVCVSELPQATSPGKAVKSRHAENSRPAALFIRFFPVLFPSMLFFPFRPSESQSFRISPTGQWSEPYTSL